MTTTIHFRPLDHAQPFHGEHSQPDRIRSQFQVGYAKTLHELKKELAAINCEKAELEADFTPQQLRITDGLPRAGETPATPRVRLTFERPKIGTVAIACDRYLNWHCNVRAIRLTLEHLRAIERYAGMQTDQQYRGYAQLPASSRPEDNIITPIGAAHTLNKLADTTHLTRTGDLLTDRELYKCTVRAATKRHHPDTQILEDSDKRWPMLTRCVEILGKHWDQTK